MKTIKYIRTFFRLKNEIKATKDRILQDIRKLFKHKKEEVNYYNPVRVSNFRSNSYIEYKSMGDRNTTIS